MSSIKISSLYELKHEISRLVRMIKRKTNQEAFNPTIQNHLIDLVKYIRTKIDKKLKVTVCIYDDEYSLNYFTDSVRWTVGVAEDGVVNYCYIDRDTPLKRGKFTVNSIPNDFNIILDKLNAVF